MHGASVFQVAHHRDGQVLKRALCLVDGVEVEHRLCGMLVGTITGIDDGYFRHLAGVACCTLQGMTHDDEVGIVAHHDDGVFQRLTLRLAAGGGIAESDDASAQAVHGCLETQSRTSRGFKKQRPHHFSFKDSLVGVLLKLFCPTKKLDNLFFGQVCD